MYYIAVEKGLDNVTEYLIERGYNIDEFYENMMHSQENFDKYDAVVTTNPDKNILKSDYGQSAIPPINSNVGGIQQGTYLSKSINNNILNQSDVPSDRSFSSVPIIDANNLTNEQIDKKIKNLK